MIYCQVRGYLDTALQLFNQSEPEDKEVKILDESMQVNGMSFESATEFVNQSLQLFDCSPLKAFKPDRTVKLGQKKVKDVTTK